MSTTALGAGRASYAPSCPRRGPADTDREPARSTIAVSTVDLARVQFATTSLYHFLFVPLTLGLAPLVAVMQTLWHRTGDEAWLRLTRFFGTLMLINFAIGVATGEKFATSLLRQVRWAERWSHPHLRFLFGHRLSRLVFGILVLAFTLAAFLAPPFSGLDTLPSLGIVLLALGVLLEDFLLAVAGFVIGALGALLVFVLGSRAVQLVQQLL